MLKNDVGVCVHFCLRPLVPLETYLGAMKTYFLRASQNVKVGFHHLKNQGESALMFGD